LQAVLPPFYVSVAFGGFIPSFNVDSQFTDTVSLSQRIRCVHFKMNGLKKIIRNMELLVIDEVSMLRADLLDAMDYMMQSEKNDSFWCCMVIYCNYRP
jgi:hypothetical protein